MVGMPFVAHGWGDMSTFQADSKQCQGLKKQDKEVTAELSLGGKTGASAQVVGLASTSCSSPPIHWDENKVKKEQGADQSLPPLYKLIVSKCSMDYAVLLTRPLGLKIT